MNFAYLQHERIIVPGQVLWKTKLKKDLCNIY